MGAKEPAEQVVRNIRRRTRKQYSAEEKIRIVLSGLRGEDSIAELCRREGIAESLYYSWSKEFLEAGRKRLSGDTARQASSGEVKDLRREMHDLKEVLAEQVLENRPIDLRNRALLAVAYDAMLRRSELASLQVSDLLEEMGGGATLLVRRSKTDGEGSGEIVYLACDTVRLVRAWLARSGITEGRLFRSVAKSGKLGERLDPSQVPRIFKEMADRAGLPETMVQGLSGHSARVGAAQDMIAAGIELPAILQAGRWKSTAMVNRYGERLLAKRSGAAQLARLQDRE